MGDAAQGARRLLVKLLEETGDSTSTDRLSKVAARRIPA
jgi:hypothetical protein